MMRVTIETQIKRHYKDIMKQFDRKLLEALKPKNALLDLRKNNTPKLLKFNS